MNISAIFFLDLFPFFELFLTPPQDPIFILFLLWTVEVGSLIISWEMRDSAEEWRCGFFVDEFVKYIIPLKQMFEKEAVVDIYEGFNWGSLKIDLVDYKKTL